MTKASTWCWRRRRKMRHKILILAALLATTVLADRTANQGWVTENFVNRTNEWKLADRRRCVVRCVSPTAASGTSHPRARLVRALLVPKVPLLAPSGAGRGLKVCSFCRRCVLRASNGFPARSGATQAAKQHPSGRLRRASPPIHWISPCGARRADGPRWWCCEGRRCRGGLTQMCHD